MKMQQFIMASCFTLAVSSCGWFSKAPTRPDNPVVMGVSYIGMTVADMASSTRLYQDAANLELVEEKTIEDSGIINQLTEGETPRFASSLLKSVNAQLRFMQFDNHGSYNSSHQPTPVNGPGIAHVCYQVNQTTNAYQKFLDHGASHIGGRDMVQINSRNPVYYAYAKDPEGIVFEVEEVDVAALDIETPPKHNHRIRHVSLATGDMERLLAFYSVLLEEQHPRRVGKWLKLSGEKLDNISGLPGSELEMAWFQTRNLEIEIVQYHSHKPETPQSVRPLNTPGYNMIMFEVSDLQAVQEKLKAADATIVIDNQMLDNMPVIFARDPDGNLLGFQTSQNGNPLSAAQFENNGI